MPKCTKDGKSIECSLQTDTLPVSESIRSGSMAHHNRNPNYFVVRLSQKLKSGTISLCGPLCLLCDPDNYRDCVTMI